jgi:dimethylglycine dehydrogenase
MDSHANIVVIGGGVVGCSVLYHLVRNGAQNCLLLERDELTSGSSWHAAGGFHTINSDPHMAKLQEYTIKLYDEIEKESGQSCGVHMVGGLILTGREDRIDFLRYTHARAQAMGIETEMISIKEAKELQPLMDETKFCGALREGLSGHLDPSGTTHAYAKAAQKKGASILKKTRVIELISQNDGSWDVVTNNGTINAQIVINAGGLWAREVGRMIGIELPLLAMEHHYLITEAIPELKNRDKELIHVVDLEGEIYMRQEAKGILLGTYEQASVPWASEQTPWDFSLELLPPDLERIAPSLEIGFSHFPALENAGIKRTVNGPFVFTPDGNPLIGPLRGYKNFWLACGVMAGFSQGGGIGMAVANWITDGDPGIDTLAIDVARFGNWTNPSYTNAKVQENYQRRFRITLPNETLPAGRPLKTSPLYETFVSHGALFDASYGLEHPLWFAGDGKTPHEKPSFRRSDSFFAVDRECQAVRSRAGIIDITSFGRYHIKGKGARHWLETILAGKIPAPGKITLCPMLDDKARILGDFTLASLDHDDYLLFGSGSAEDLHLRYFENTMPENPNFSIKSLSDSIAGISLAGPLSRNILESFVDDVGSLSAMQFLDFSLTSAQKIPCTIGRISFTGELGYEIWVTKEHLVAFFNALMDIGKPLGLSLFGARAFNSLRLEKNFGAWGHEYTPRDTALEAGLLTFIDKSRQNFRGAQALKEERNNGPSRKLFSFSFNAKDADPHGDEPLFHHDQVISRVTSAGFGHCASKSIAMAYLPSDFNDFQNLFVDVLGDKIPVKVEPKPLIDPSGNRMRT